MWYVFILPHRAPRPVKVRIRSATFGQRPLVADLDRRFSKIANVSRETFYNYR